MLIISTVVRWWCGSRVAAGLHISTFDEIQELPTNESDAIDLVRTDDEGWQRSDAAGVLQPSTPDHRPGDRTH
jgi:hypothetical protein